jgi:hypothetical protein
MIIYRQAKIACFFNLHVKCLNKYSKDLTRSICLFRFALLIIYMRMYTYCMLYIKI